ncbi:DUF4832 domain-containing protein [bacterium]|nr:DUF4832 domain-containing protein [bacterium]
MPALLVVAVLVSSVAALAQDTPPGPVELKPPASDEVIFNPGMGLYLQYPPLDAKPDEWFMQLCDIAYYRLDWSEVNPEEGVYKFDDYFGPRFDFWVKQCGKRVAFRVMCQSMHSRGQVTPPWVFAKGVPGVKHIALNGQEQTDPVFWDDRYLDVQCEFIRKLGEYLDGRPGLEFVDIGSIGEWGEMHLMRWTPQQLAETGYTEARYVAAYRRVIDAHVQAFPHTRIFLNVGGRNHLTINDYAAIHGVNFRQDGLNPAGASYDCGEWLYNPYARRGVICNFEFHSGYDEMLKKQWDVKTTIEKGLSAPISYLNTNLFGGAGYRKAPPEAQELLRDAARRIGYRFVLVSLKHPAQLRLYATQPSRLPLFATWRNDGVAPCYASYAVQWSLVGPDGKVACEQLDYPPTPTTLWWPGEEQQVGTVLRLPAGLPAGQYRLRVAMLDPEAKQMIRLALTGRDDSGAYRLVELTGVASAATNATVHENGFEQEPTSWNPVEGIKLSLSTEGPHSGASCLLAEGTAGRVWNYAQTRLQAAAVPYGLYRLSAWMLVETTDNPRKAPYLKLATNAADGKWITNYSTNPYDLRQLGTWQRLETTAELPANAAALDIAIEKGDNTTPIALRLRLDDVKVELLEAP